MVIIPPSKVCQWGGRGGGVLAFFVLFCDNLGLFLFFVLGGIMKSWDGLDFSNFFECFERTVISLKTLRILCAMWISHCCGGHTYSDHKELNWFWKSYLFNTPRGRLCWQLTHYLFVWTGSAVRFIEFMRVIVLVFYAQSTSMVISGQRIYETPGVRCEIRLKCVCVCVCVCACVCVCVCVWERERERERENVLCLYASVQNQCTCSDNICALKNHLSVAYILLIVRPVKKIKMHVIVCVCVSV